MGESEHEKISEGGCIISVDHIQGQVKLYYMCKLLEDRKSDVEPPISSIYGVLFALCEVSEPVNQ